MAFIFAIITAFSFTVSNLFFKIAAKDGKHLFDISVLYNFFASAFIIPIIVSEQHVSIEKDPKALIILGSWVGWTIFSYFQLWLNNKISASTNALLYQVTPVFSFILGILLLGESFEWLKILGIFLIVGGNTSLFVGKSALKVDKTFFVRMFLNLVLALTYTADSIASPYFSQGFFMFINFLVPGLLLWAFHRDINIKSLIKGAKNKFWSLLGIALPGVVGYFFLLKAYVIGDISVIIPITASQTILTVLGASIFLGERENMLKKIILAIIVFAGVVVLGLV